MTKGAAWTTIVKALVAIFGLLEESLTLRVKLKDPAVLGTPEILPLALLSVRPLGKLPAETDHV
jgi:hypothetical protein